MAEAEEEEGGQTMIDENTQALLDQLRQIQSSVNTCAWLLGTIALLVAAIVWHFKW